MASASIPSVNELAKASFLVHTVKLKPIIISQISGKLVTSGIRDVAILEYTPRKNSYEKDVYDNY